jgi:glycosyltransferase involved in cell wall biosynthesis
MFDVNIVVSEADREEGEQLGILRGPRTELIRSGVNVERIQHPEAEAVAEIRTRYAPNDEPLVSLIGRLSMPKTPDVFVDAAAIVLKRHPRARFLVVGDGAKREEIAALIQRHQIGDSVFMTGLSTDIPAFMAASDIIVHSSLREGLPKIVLEGMAAGKPVIGTSVGGVPAVIDDGVSGLLVAPNDVPQMAAAIERLLSDEPLRQRIVASSASRVYEFSLQKSIEDTDHLYDRLISDRSRRYP